MHNTLVRGEEARIDAGLEVTHDLLCVQLPLVNVYLFGECDAGDREWVLVDAGMGTSAPHIIRAAAERFRPNSRPSAIVLTHGHFDHVGSLKQLADLWDAPVYAHRLEMPYLTGQSDYPPPDPTVPGGAVAKMSRLFPRKAIDVRDRLQALPEDGSVPGMPGWRWIHTPGHAPGHVSMFRDSDRALIVGDAFVTQRQESLLSVITRRPEVRRPPAYFTIDWDLARRSVGLLAELEPSVAATGHGLPMYGEGMRYQLRMLARNFDSIAVPPDGRYVRQPALADETGVLSVPPPVPDRLLMIGGIGLAAVVGAAFLRSRASNRGTG